MENPPAEPGDTHQPDGPLLDAVEARILGCLIEKQATTPDAYPLTQNAVVAACNQKSNRDPHMDLEPGEVGHALRQLEARGLVTGTLAARASRYEHRVDAAWAITPRQRAVLCILLLRGPQTLGELATRTERLAEFPDPQDLRDTLDRLMNRTPALVMRIGRRPGQREDRYTHLLCGPVATEDLAAPSPSDVQSRPRSALEQRVLALEATVAELGAEIARLRERIDVIDG
jgi:uncharacterized protein YceH (UPF0502 family)